MKAPKQSVTEINAGQQGITDTFGDTTEYIGDARLGSRSAQNRLGLFWNEETRTTDTFGGVPVKAAKRSVMTKAATKMQAPNVLVTSRRRAPNISVTLAHCQ